MRQGAISYPALPDRRIPFDIDGTVLAKGTPQISATHATLLAQGLSSYITGTTRINLNGSSGAGSGLAIGSHSTGPWTCGSAFWVFFPESREVTGLYLGLSLAGVGLDTTNFALTLEGSINTTNGVDGTWESASLPSGAPLGLRQLDGFRAYVHPVSFTGGKRAIRFVIGTSISGVELVMLHLYGEKTAGQTPDDLIFIDHDTTPGAEYTAPEDFGDRPLGTTGTRQFRVKNASATKTANTINLQCNDADFTISTNGTTWVVTIDIASLAPGAESATLYVRNTTPALGNVLGPRFNEIVATVSSWV